MEQNARTLSEHIFIHFQYNFICAYTYVKETFFSNAMIYTTIRMVFFFSNTYKQN
jgi:hypothetical protein